MKPWPAFLWSNRLYGLFHGPMFLRAFAAWVLPRWYGARMSDEERRDANASWGEP